MRITILTLFPEYFVSPLSTSMLKRATNHQLVEFAVVDLRQFTTDKHHTTDDHPYGGGAGMVMMVEPIHRALSSLGDTKGHVVLTSAKGKRFTQADAKRWSQLPALTVIAGHYEGVDERVAEHLVDEEVRIGDYVLTGGEPAAAVMIDAITRLIPGVLGNEQSLVGESHEVPGKLGYPQYTRPEEYQGWRVPEELLSGNHALIERWRDEHGKIEGDDETS